MSIKDYVTKYRPSQKAMDMVDEILTQRDARYVDPWSHVIVAGFIANSALSIASEVIKEPQKEEPPFLSGPQEELKRIAAWLLKKRGFEVRGCEIWAPGGRADIVGVKGNEHAFVECGPCRIDKPIEYLKKPDAVLWVLAWTGDYFMKGKEVIQDVVLHEISRGKNWNSFLRFHEGERSRMMREAMKKLNSSRVSDI